MSDKDKDWMLQTRETRRSFSNATWIPLRASVADEHNDVREIGYSNDVFACGSLAIPPEHHEFAEKLGWSDIGIGHNVLPYADREGYYKPIDQYQYHNNETIGVELVLEHPQPVVGGRLWILNPDLVVALGLIKEGNTWVRPEENFVVVARESLDANGRHTLIEIKREFLLDYLAARNLSLRLSYYRERVENVASIEGSKYEGLANIQDSRDSGRFELLVRTLESTFGGSWASFRMWRTDVDEDEDAPVMGPEHANNTDSESSKGYRGGYDGVRIESNYWRDEWIEHKGQSLRVRGDSNPNLPQFIVETDSSRMDSASLKDEDIGRWLWFRSSVVNELLSHRGFSLIWYTAQTGAINSTCGLATHFGINSADLITVYAYDIARLPAWEQQIWAAHNVVPEGKVSSELLDSQVKAKPANTRAVEALLFQSIKLLEQGFRKRFGISLFNHSIEETEATQIISRFVSRDRASLLRLAKDLVRIFTDRVNAKELRKLSSHPDKDKLQSNKLLESVLAQEIGDEEARRICGVIVGVYDMRIGDAHPTGSKIGDALKLAGLEETKSHLRQGEQLIGNYGEAIWLVGKHLFDKPPK